MERLRSLPLGKIGNALLLGGIALLGVASIGGRLVSEGTVLAVSAPQSSGSPTSVPTFTSTPTLEFSGSISIPQSTVETVQPAPPATRLVVPALEVDAPVVELPSTDKTWDMSGLTYEIAHLGGTASPGEKNNMVLAGHVTLRVGAGPFLHLERLEAGDTAIVYTGHHAYTYRVVDKKHVAPTDVSVAYPTSDPILTLITCTSWDIQNRAYSERVAVVARLVEERPPVWTSSRIEPEK